MLPDNSSVCHSSVDPVSWVHFDYGFRVRFMKARGTEFQTLFADVMSKAYGEDFAPSGTWGREGDLKCDGYLHSERTVFAVYAPKDFNKQSKAKQKLRGDHVGACGSWLSHMSAWVVVHNADPSLSAPMLKFLLQLEATQPGVTVRDWSLDRLRDVLRRLTRRDLVEILGDVPDASDLATITQADVKRAVEDLAVFLDRSEKPAASADDLRTVPAEKIRFNRLNQTAGQLLNLGRIHSRKIHEYFEGHTDPYLADAVVDAFKMRYDHLVATGLHPDDIFSDLTSFAGWRHKDRRVSVAGLSVVAYLFEACHIFERPRELPPSTDAHAASN
jgi:hypothetical protein